MAKIKLTKTELKAQTDALKRFQRFLPMLQLKKQQLQGEIAGITAKAEDARAKERAVREGLDSWVGLFATDESLLAGLVSVKSVKTGTANIAGVAIPTFESIDTEVKEIDAWSTPAWVDDAVEATTKILSLQCERAVYEEQRRLVAEELKQTSQRVNLFEKVKIPQCKEAIRAGEVIQIVPSQKFTAKTDIPPLALYRALRLVNPSPYNFFLRVGSKTLIGSSPEELVRLEKGIGSIAPIAGTRPRGATPEMDRALEAELLADPKERAEHMMLVDLARNDLGRVAKTGTVAVRDLAHIERYSHVMHIVSNVYGELDPEKADAQGLFKAAFPAGTLTGAPKIRAMELLAEYEKSPRGVYGGAAGYFSYTGDMDFAIVIRTMVLENGTLTMRAGAGIVADSDPAKEYQETINKSKAVFQAAEFAKELV